MSVGRDTGRISPLDNIYVLVYKVQSIVLTLLLLSCLFGTKTHIFVWEFFLSAKWPLEGKQQN